MRVLAMGIPARVSLLKYGILGVQHLNLGQKGSSWKEEAPNRQP